MLLQWNNTGGAGGASVPWNAASLALPPAHTLTRSGTNATYYNSSGLLTTAGADVARFSYNPATLALEGLMVEAAATNLILQSAAFDDATWAKTAATVTANAINSPTGTANADYIVATAVLSTHLVGQTVAVSSGAVYTLSAFLKAGGETTGTLAISNSPFPRILFNLSAGTISSSQGGGTGTITSVGNGWYFCTCTFTSPAVSITPIIAVRDIDANWTGNGVDGIYAFGAQLETGGSATSYIATTAAAATRNADVLTAATSGLLSNTQGFAAISGKNIAVPTTSNSPVYLSGSAGGNGMFNGGDGKVYVYDGTNVVGGAAISLTAGASFSAAATWGGSSMNVASSGVLGTSGAFDGDLGLGANIRLFANTDGSQIQSVYLKSLRYGQRTATSSELGGWTT